MKKTFLFLAAAIFTVSNLFAEEVTVTKTIAEVQAYNNWETQYVDQNGFWHRTWNLDENIQFAALPESPESSSTQNGILYLNPTTSVPSDWRLYQARGGFQIIAKEGCVLKSATFEFGNKNGGCLVYGGENYTNGQTITFDGTKALEEIAVGSTSGATNGQARISNFTVVYEKGGTPERVLKSIYVDGTAEKLEYFVGEEFDPAGLKVMGKYDTGDDTEITAGIVWTIDPEVLAKEDISVDVTAQYKDFTSAPFTVNNIVVKEKVVPTGYAGTYTSDVELVAGENSQAAVIIYDSEEYNGVKCGTSSKAGVCTMTIPAATKMLHFHAIGWKGATATTLTVNGAEYSITSEDGITGNPPFTLVGDAYEYYYTFDPKGETQITITSGKRFVLFGVNAELEEGTVAAPSFEPTAGDFDQEVEVTLTAEEGAEIFYALNEEVTSMNAIQYTEPIKLTETTTIYAVAKKDGKESAQVNKTYTLIPAFESLEALVTNLPATDTKVKVKVTLTDVAIDSFYVSGKYTNGVYVTANGAAVELYKYDVPTTWEVGGTISGTILADWSLYKGVAELQNFDSWDAFTYTAPGEPTRIFNPKANKVAKKAIVNGQIMIIRDNRTYNVLGF